MEEKTLKKGLLITFEGPEGSGKSTQVRLLCDYLHRLHFRILQLREPGGTIIGEKIRNILLDPKNKNMDIVCEMLLYQAARAQLVREKVLSALQKKKIIVLDRFLDATICYQGYGAKLNINPVLTRKGWINLIKQIGRLTTFGIQPDLTILLDIDTQQGLHRSKRRDRIERKSLQFHQRVRKGYLKLANANLRRIKVIPVNKNIIEIQSMIRKIVHKLLRVASHN
jgi:dTMP kinase